MGRDACSSAVNSFPARSSWTRIFRDDSNKPEPVASSNIVNKPVHKFTLLERKCLLGSHQFIERAEMGGGGQQIDAKNLKDNPR